TSYFSVFFYCSVNHQDLHSFPTRRSSDLNKDKVLMDFAIFAIAFNLGKLHLKGLVNKEILYFFEKYGQKGDVILFFVKIDINSRSEEHTSELQSRENLVCRLLLEKKKK